jgi:hypothetical protein
MLDRVGTRKNLVKEPTPLWNGQQEPRRIAEVCRSQAMPNARVERPAASASSARSAQNNSRAGRAPAMIVSRSARTRSYAPLSSL